jgi:hypothetical protein
MKIGDQTRPAAGTPARGHPHRGREWVVLFSAGNLDFCLGDIDDLVEYDSSLDKKITAKQVLG